MDSMKILGKLVSDNLIRATRVGFLRKEFIAQMQLADMLVLNAASGCVGMQVYVWIQIQTGSDCSMVVTCFQFSKRILVDPASCHMLVSKIKPCMSKYTLWHSETANGSLNQLWFIRSCVLCG